MEQTSDVPPTQPPPDPPARPDTYQRIGTALKALRRSTSERVFAGVCGGVARSLGLDPTFVRVLVAVLVPFGGLGVLLYVLGWLLLPQDDGRRSVAERAAARSNQGDTKRPLALAVLLIVLALIGASLVFDKWDGTLLLVLLAVGLVVWIDRRTGRVQQPPPAPPASASAPTAATTTLPADDVTQPVSPAPPPVRSVLFATTLSCLVLALGVLGAVDGAGGEVAGDAYPALGLAVVGAGLVVGAWRGRSRGLIVLGLALALATAGAIGADRGGLGRDAVDLTLRPTGASEIPRSARYTVGNASYDLRGVDFGGTKAAAALSIGAGELIVIVPRDVDVTGRTDVGLGEVSLFHQRSEGPGIERTFADVGADGPGGGSLDLTLHAGVGRVEVRRG